MGGWFIRSSVVIGINGARREKHIVDVDDDGAEEIKGERARDCASPLSSRR